MAKTDFRLKFLTKVARCLHRHFLKVNNFNHIVNAVWRFYNSRVDFIKSGQFDRKIEVTKTKQKRKEK